MKKRIISTAIIAIAIIATIIILRPSKSETPVTTQTTTPAVTDATIWPSVANKTLSDQTVEYRVTTNPELRDSYCVSAYNKDTTVYRFAGQIKYSDAAPECS